MCRDRDAALAANGHAGDANVPAFDDFTATELEAEGLAFLVCWLGVRRWGEYTESVRLERLTVKDFAAV